MQKSNVELEEYERLRKKFRTVPTFMKNPQAMEVVEFKTLDLSLIAPIEPEMHNGVRINGVDQEAVNAFRYRIENGLYDPLAETPPCVTELPKGSKQYRKGYRYRMTDGHHRREAHLQLNLPTIEVAVVRFLPVDGETAEFWRIAFMVERNDPTNTKFYSLPSTSADKAQAARLMISVSKKNATTKQEVPAVKHERINQRTKEVADLLGVTAASQIREIHDAILRAEADNDPDFLKHIVHYYNDYYWKKHIEEFCETYNVDPSNVLARPFYLKDESCSRDDYTQFHRLIQTGMEDISNLKTMAFLGTAADCKNVNDVYVTRRRKSKLVADMIDYVSRMHEWLSIPKNRKALLSVPMYWLTQTYEEPKVGTVIQVDSTTGKLLSKKRK